MSSGRLVNTLVFNLKPGEDTEWHGFSLGICDQTLWFEYVMLSAGNCGNYLPLFVTLWQIQDSNTICSINIHIFILIIIITIKYNNNNNDNGDNNNDNDNNNINNNIIKITIVTMILLIIIMMITITIITIIIIMIIITMMTMIIITITTITIAMLIKIITIITIPITLMMIMMIIMPLCRLLQIKDQLYDIFRWYLYIYWHFRYTKNDIATERNFRWYILRNYIMKWLLDLSHNTIMHNDQNCWTYSV